ncbi:hypothetical protein Vi05172_g9872 [Venturia inaequalis]|uniref:DUF6594 domain-containing protein n=1 Tax=Venturia inaequalis TaxID=5025 RepID=A0A8H3ZDR6_VENIN|nr:hypothetical protein EG327_003337 [Venturia inaequalis]RDI80112.1 hypothetical protein Vi05172_g9872 [Venturia inaequalis]
MAQVPNVIGGYPRLATQMGLFPEVAIFKTFGDLTARNLLYLQAELLLLHGELRKAEKIDTKIKGRHCATDYNRLHELGNTEKEDRHQWELVLQLRAKLKEYGKPILL